MLVGVEVSIFRVDMFVIYMYIVSELCLFLKFYIILPLSNSNNMLAHLLLALAIYLVHHCFFSEKFHSRNGMQIFW